jgi:DNA-binding IclR family transcriptional regulator
LSGTYLLSFDPSHPLRFQLRPGDTIASLHATSAGLALLASLDPRKLAEVLERIRLVPLTRNTPKTITELHELIEAGRNRGYHVNAEYSVDGLTALSASFTWQQITYIVTVAAPTARLVGRIEEAAVLLLDAGRRLEMRNTNA